jgi:hypothetical protein
MADMIIIEPYAFSIGDGLAPMNISPGLYVAGNQGLGTGINNLLRDDPREVWQSAPAETNVGIWIDLGVDTFWDSLYLVNTNMPAGATWRIYDGSAASVSYTQNLNINGGVFAPARRPSEDNIPDVNGPCFYWSPALRLARYIYIVVNLNTATQLRIGNVVVGRGLKPSLPRELGAGRPPLDTGSRTRMEGGGLAIVSGALVSGFRWTFGDLSPSDLGVLWGLLRRRRSTGVIALIEDPEAPAAEQCHYGHLTNLEIYERSDTSKSRWSMTMEDWT